MMDGQQPGNGLPPELFGQPALGIDAPIPVSVPPQQVIDRNPPEPDPNRAAFVKDWLEQVKSAEDFFSKQFKQMRDDQQFARGKQWVDGDEKHKYVANITLRHIQERTSALYARNPRVVAKRRPRLEYQFWDGQQQSLMMAIQMPANPISQAIIQEVQAAKLRQQAIDKVGKTLEILMHYFMDEQSPGFKLSLKQLVRRVMTTGVGFVKIGYQRIMEHSPETAQRISDMTGQLHHLMSLMADVADKEADNEQAAIEELKQAVAALQSQKEIILREGLTFDFPLSDQVIIDPACVQIKGFVGAGWIAQKYLFEPKKVQEIYGVDLGKNYLAYNPQGQRVNKKYKNPLACVYEIWDIDSGMKFTLADGYRDYLDAPQSPDFTIGQFHPFFALTFNDVEDDECIYPPSDVHLLRHMQLEYNRSREFFRQHRRANKPAYAVPKGVLAESDLDDLANHAHNDVIEFEVPPGTNMNQVVIPLAKAPIDPNLYDTEYLYTDMQRTTGDQSANLGGTSDTTATEASISEQSRISTLSSNIDDLDDLLSGIARAGGQIMLQLLSSDTAKHIAGPGAVWPTLSNAEIEAEMYLDTKAGSSGRPNRAAELANLERVAPYLIQLPGIPPQFLVNRFLETLDDGINLDEAYIEGIPSILSLNAMTKGMTPGLQPSTGNPATDPNMQGEQGTDNAQGIMGGQPGGQPGYTAPDMNQTHMQGLRQPAPMPNQQPA